VSYHQYYCDKCKTEIEIKIYSLDGEWFLVEELTPEEIAKLPEDVDPRFLDKETKLKDVPSFVKCPDCGNKKAAKIIHEVEGWVKGNCFTNRERERKFHEYGMDKKRAETFYQESIQASKDRMKTGGEMYKKVSPDMDHMRSTGRVKKLSDKESLQKKEKLKQVNTELQKQTKKPKG